MICYQTSRITQQTLPHQNDYTMELYLWDDARRWGTIKSILALHISTTKTNRIMFLLMIYARRVWFVSLTYVMLMIYKQRAMIYYQTSRVTHKKWLHHVIQNVRWCETLRNFLVSQRQIRLSNERVTSPHKNDHHVITILANHVARL